MLFVNDAMAAGEAAQVGGFEGLMLQLLPLILIFVVFWFFLIRPQQKRQKEHTKMVEGLMAGDEVQTIGGIFGRIASVKDDNMVLQIATVEGKPVTITMLRNAVQSVLPKGTLSF